MAIMREYQATAQEDGSIKETALEYVQAIPQETLDAIKQEFSGKTFQVSQGMVWQNGSASYSNQLLGFANLSKIIQSQSEKMEVLRGATRYVYNGNWKLQAENGLDGYHVTTTHLNYLMTTMRRASGAISAGGSER